MSRDPLGRTEYQFMQGAQNMLNSSLPLETHFCFESLGEKKVAYLRSAEPILRSSRDFLDFMGWAGEQGTNLLLVTDTSFEPAFYDLSTGLAGEIFQKVSNYRQRIAIIGSFDMVKSKRFREFMTECNKGRSVGFLPNEAAAFNWLAAEQL